LASVRVSQHKRDEALQLVQKSYDQWKDLGEKKNKQI